MRKSGDNWWPPQAPRLAGNARLSLITLARRKDNEKKSQIFQEKRSTPLFSPFPYLCVRGIPSINQLFPPQAPSIHAKSKGPFISIYKTWRNFKSFFLPRELWVCLFEPINSSADCLAGLSETLTVKNCPRLRLVFRFTVKIENSRQRDQSEEKNFQAKSRFSSV